MRHGRPQIEPQKVKSELVKVYLRPSELAALDDYCRRGGESRSRAVRNLLHEFLTDDQAAVRDGIAALRALTLSVQELGHNLNQLVRGYHRGLIPHPAPVRDLVTAISEAVQQVRTELRARRDWMT